MSVRHRRSMQIAVLAAAIFGAQAAVAQSCSVQISDMKFGSAVDTLSGAATDTTAALTYNCSGGNPGDRLLLCVHLGDGSVPASGGYRRMMSANSYLNYQIYQTSDRTAVWGSATNGNPPPPIAAVIEGSGSASGQVPIFGRLIGGQSAAEAATYLSSFSGAHADARYRVTDDTDCASLAGMSSAAVSFNVEAVVAKDCIVATQPVSFGSHGTLQRNVDATGTVSVMCTPATGYAIRLNGGNTDSAPTARKMSKGSETVTYGLYRNSSRDQPWGNTEETLATSTGNGSHQTHIVYGRVPPQPTPSAGTYTDTVVVTVDY